MKYRVILLTMVLGACGEQNRLLSPFETAPAGGLSDAFRACVSREAVAVVQRVSSRGQVALVARHDEMNRDVAAACDVKDHVLGADEISYIAREVDKEIEARKAKR